MTRLLVLLLLASLPGAQGALERARAARMAGSFGSAWDELSRVDEVLEAERERLELYYAAGEPLAALGHAEAGLSLAPDDLGLLHRSLSLSEWIGDASGMFAFLARLEAAVERESLESAAREQWRGEVARFRERAQALRLATERRERALARARTTALGVMGLGLLFLLALTYSPGQRSAPARSGLAG